MRFGIGIFEILLILVVMVIFIPPKQIPVIIRECAKVIKHINEKIKEIAN